jgi:hypothetical protein
MFRKQHKISQIPWYFLIPFEQRKTKPCLVLPNQNHALTGKCQTMATEFLTKRVKSELCQQKLLDFQWVEQRVENFELEGEQFE